MATMCRHFFLEYLYVRIITSHKNRKNGLEKNLGKD